MTDHNNGTRIWVAVVVGVVLALPMIYLVVLGPLLYNCCTSGTLEEGSLWDIATVPLKPWANHFGRLPEFYRDYLAWWARLAGMPI